MSTPEPLKVAGVPEAFNECFTDANFTANGLPSGAEFLPYPGGSGSMVKAVVSGAVDAAFALTDCIVAAIEGGSPVRLAGPVVSSALVWGVVVGGRSGVAGVDELRSATWGVSRLGSGSHVMVRTMAKQRGWGAPRFVVCGDFAGLRDGVNTGKVDAFLWEVFTTGGYARSGEVRIVGEVPTPWGCFSVAVREDVGTEGRVRVEKMRSAFVQAGRRMREGEGSAERIAGRYGMSVAEAGKWLEGVRYAETEESRVSTGELEVIREALLEAGVIEEKALRSIESYHSTKSLP